MTTDTNTSHNELNMPQNLKACHEPVQSRIGKKQMFARKTTRESYVDQVQQVASFGDDSQSRDKGTNSSLKEDTNEKKERSSLHCILEQLRRRKIGFLTRSEAPTKGINTSQAESDAPCHHESTSFYTVLH